MVTCKSNEMRPTKTRFRERRNIPESNMSTSVNNGPVYADWGNEESLKSVVAK